MSKMPPFARSVLAFLLVGASLFLMCEAFGQQSTAEKMDGSSVQSDAAPPPRPLDDLAKDDYSIRQTATIQMWRDRETSRQMVQEAARNSDPEISGRAQWILRQWRRGALPDTPPEISRLLQSGDQTSSIERLLEAGQFLATVVAVEESAGTVDRESIQRRINSSLARRFPIYVHLAIRSESLHHLLDLVDLVADSNETAACRIELMQLLGIPITDDVLLPRAAEAWPAGLRDTVTAMLMVKLDRYDDAIRIATASGDDELLLNCRTIASRWRDIADDRAALAKQSEMGTIEHCLYWCQTMSAADRCGDRVLFDQAVAQLTAPEICKQEVAVDLLWKYLASHGKVAEALAILERSSPDSAASVAIDSSRTLHAFDVIGFPLDRVDSDYQLWIDQALSAQRDGNSEELSPALRRLMVLIQCLLSVGRDDTAWVIARRLCDSDVRIGTHRKIRVAEYVLSTLTMTKRTDWITRLAIDPVDHSLSPDSLDIVARTLPQADGTTIEIVMDTLSKMDPTLTPEKRFLWAVALLDGRVPVGFDENADFERFFNTVTRPRAARMNPGDRARSIPIQANMNIVLMFSGLGQSKLASDCLTKLAASGDTDAIFRMAEHALDAGRSDTATKLFELVFRRIEVQGRGGGADDVTLAGKSLIGLWTIARRQGDQVRSDELLQELRLVLCSPSSHTRHSLATYLADRNETALAIEAYQQLLPIKLFGSNDSVDLYTVTRGFALTARDSIPNEAARWFDVAVNRSIESDDFRPSAFVTLPMYVHRWKLEAAIAGGEGDLARQQIDRLLQLDPLDIDLAERLLPKMREASLGDLADETFDRVMDQGIAYTESFSLDAMMCNNLAWVAAMNARRLDDAKRLSEMAVSTEPDSAIYRDTLAEVLYLMGEKKAALQIEKGCLLDDPGQWHLHEQIQRFSE